MKAYFTDEAVREMEGLFRMNERVWQLLDIILTEFKGNPSICKYLDHRIYTEAKHLVAKRKSMDDICNPFLKQFKESE